jgi:putative glycerol-1-phosphate prenyltransferase
MKVYNDLLLKKRNGKKSFAILIDPDHTLEPENISEIIELGNQNEVDYYFVGGSFFLKNRMDECIRHIRKQCQTPVVLFPGNAQHIHPDADAILFLSLISGRNPEYLIGQHVLSAPELYRSNLEIIPAGYILVDGGKKTTVSYITFSEPMPNDKPELVATTALAGQYLGLKLIYLEAGSGASIPVSTEIINMVRTYVTLPIITGGGINTPEKAYQSFASGTDLLVIGNKIKQDPGFIREIRKVKKEFE